MSEQSEPTNVLGTVTGIARLTSPTTLTIELAFALPPNAWLYGPIHQAKPDPDGTYRVEYMYGTGPAVPNEW